METGIEGKRHRLIYDHYISVFGEEPVFSLRPKEDILSDGMVPMTTSVFRPTDRMPFWKLCTIGASDYLMPERDIGWCRKANRRNEYMMLIAPEVEVDESGTGWLLLNSLLWSTAGYASCKEEAVTVSDTIDMGLEGKYCGTVLLLPEVFESPDIVKCHYTKHRYVSIFQVMPITRELLSEKLERGTEGIHWLMEHFYTHDDDYNLIASRPFATL